MQAALTSRWGNAHNPGPRRMAIPPRHQERRWAGAGGTSLFCPTTLPAAGSRGPESWCQNRLVTWEPCPRPLQPQTGPPSSGAGTARGMALLGEWQRQEHEQGQAPLGWHSWRCGEGGSVWAGGDTGMERRGRVEGGGAHPGEWGSRAHVGTCCCGPMGRARVWSRETLSSSSCCPRAWRPSAPPFSPSPPHPALPQPPSSSREPSSSLQSSPSFWRYSPHGPSWGRVAEGTWTGQVTGRIPSPHLWSGMARDPGKQSRQRATG